MIRAGDSRVCLTGAFCLVLAAGAARAAGPEGQDLAARLPLWSEEAAAWIAGGREFYVAEDGRPTNAGTKDAPWDLRSTLEGRQALRGGDVVWVRGGTYKGCFNVAISGTPGRPVVVRAVPGERAVLDSSDRTGGRYAFEVRRPWGVYWGLEIMNSDPTSTTDRAPGYEIHGPNTKLINCLVHDVAVCGFWTPAVDAEIYGSLLYNIGGQRTGRGQGNGHNIYTQNREGTKLIRDNIIFNGFRNGIDSYTERGFIEGFHISGNTVFGASASANEGDRKMDILVGGLRPAARILLQENYAWSNGLGRCVQLGYGGDESNKDVTLIDNYFAGRLEFARPWEKIVMTGNKLFGPVRGNVDTAQDPDNDYGPPPKETAVFLRPNLYEPGRVNITVFNWAGDDVVAVDVGSVVPVGAEFEVRNAQNWHKGPVAGGVFDAKPVSLPMVGMDPVQPIGAEGYITREEMSGKCFNVFVVMAWAPGSRARAPRE